MTLVSDDFRVEGMNELNALAANLRKVGDGKEIRKELLAALRAAGAPVADDMRTALAARLPQRGGAAKAFTRKKKTFAVRNRVADSAKQSAGVRITSANDAHDYASLEQAGKLRHPKHPGRRPRRSWRWDEQKVPTEGLLEGVLDDHGEEFHAAIVEAMSRAADAIEASLDKGV